VECIECGANARGVCIDCGVGVCGEHSQLVEGKRSHATGNVVEQRVMPARWLVCAVCAPGRLLTSRLS
jgi:hypothetical protein